MLAYHWSTCLVYSCPDHSQIVNFKFHLEDFIGQSVFGFAIKLLSTGKLGLGLYWAWKYEDQPNPKMKMTRPINEDKDDLTIITATARRAAVVIMSRSLSFLLSFIHSVLSHFQGAWLVDVRPNQKPAINGANEMSPWSERSRSYGLLKNEDDLKMKTLKTKDDFKMKTTPPPNNLKTTKKHKQ